MSEQTTSNQVTTTQSEIQLVTAGSPLPLDSNLHQGCTNAPVQVADIPTPIFQRDFDTGLVIGQAYPRRADGRIDWVQLIPKEQIVFNTNNPKIAADIEKAYGKPAKELNYGELVAAGVQVNPKHLLVLLQGFVEVASLRGYSATGRIAHALSYPPEAAISICECNIDWHPNVEEPNGFSSYGTADATMENTGGWGYLSAMAGNRAFVRAVRQGLRIPIMSFDEIAKKDMQLPESSQQTPVAAFTASGSSPTGALERCAAEMKCGFETLKKGASTKYRQKIETNPELWNSWADVPPRDCWTLINILKTSAEEKGKAKSG
jgi:hypothetical protein